MGASVINAVLVLIGGSVGLLFRAKIKESYASTIFSGLGICVILIGIMSGIQTADILCVIICIVLGTLLGEKIGIEAKLDRLGETVKSKIMKTGDNSTFTQGFMTATLMYCVGSMAIMGSLDAGILGDYSIILSKSVIDCVSAVTLAATMGIGVCFSAAPILIYQGLLTLLAIYIGPLLDTAVVTEMTAVGGVLLIGIGINMLSLAPKPLRVGNMLPAIFLPIFYIPLAQWIVSQF